MQDRTFTTKITYNLVITICLVASLYITQFRMGVVFDCKKIVYC